MHYFVESVVVVWFKWQYNLTNFFFAVYIKICFTIEAVRWNWISSAKCISLLLSAMSNRLQDDSFSICNDPIMLRSSLQKIAYMKLSSSTKCISLLLSAMSNRLQDVALVFEMIPSCWDHCYKKLLTWNFHNTLTEE